MFVRSARGSLLRHFLMVALCSAAAGAAEPADGPGEVTDAVTDPVSVTWNKGCVVQRYSPRQTQWLTYAGPRSVLPLKVVPAVGPHAAAALDPMRGCSGWLFDLHAEKWMAIPRSPISPPEGMVTPTTAAFVGERLVVWGRIGQDPNDDAAQGAVLDTKTMTWTPMAKAPVVPRYRCVTAVVGSRLLLWGGYGPTGPNRIGPLADGAVYDVDKDAWDKLPDPPVPGDRYGCSAVAWNGRMVIVGGRRGREVVRTGIMYDPDARRWEKMTDMPGDLGVQAACVVSGDSSGRARPGPGRA